MRVKKTFYGAQETVFENDTVEVIEREGEILIAIRNEDGHSILVALDVPTAICFSKELRKSINISKGI